MVYTYVHFPCLDLFMPLQGSLDDAPPPFFCGNDDGAHGSPK